MKLKIVQEGWEGYNGILGPVVFEGGISVDHVTQREADRFGVSMRFVEVDDEGNELGVVSANADLIVSRTLRADPAEPYKSVAQIEAENPPAPEATTPEVEAPNPMPVETPVEAKTYTREELEAVADKDGIKGLRVIGTPLGAKNTSIGKLIDEILDAQTKAARG